jgi:hypothetical protein
MKEFFEPEDGEEESYDLKVNQEPGVKGSETVNECLDEIQDKEVEMFRKAEKVLDGLTLKEFKSKPAAMLLAFSIFANASTAFADDSGLDDNYPDFFYDNVPTTVAKDSKSSFWSKFFSKFELSYNKQSRYLTDDPSEILNLDGSFPSAAAFTGSDSSLEDEVVNNGRREGLIFFSESIYPSDNVGDFFEKLNDASSELTDSEKVFFLQNLGRVLGYTYNYDMLENGEYVQVSDDTMFDAARAYQIDGKLVRTGICGNIETFQARATDALGLPSWLESGSRESIGHIVSGIVANIGGKEQIIFNDYGKMVLTDTLDYSKALGVLERHLGRVGTFNSFVANDTSVLFPVKSQAQEVVEYASGMRKTETRLSRNIQDGELRSDEGFKIKVTPEFKEVKINNGYVGLSHLNFEDVNNSPYQSIEKMDASRFTAMLKGNHLGVEADVTILNMTLKDLYNGNIDLKELVGRVAADYINTHSLTTEEYGNFLLSYGATLQAAIRMPMEKENRDNVTAMAESGIGTRLTYIPKGSGGKFYVGVSEIFRGQADNFQDQDPVLKRAEETFTIGGSFRAQQATIIGLEAKKTNADWGSSLRLSATAKKGKLKAGVYSQEEDSGYERFIPSKKEFGVGLSYKSGPKWQVDVFAAKEARQYEGADSKDSYNTEIKFRIFLW